MIVVRRSHTLSEHHVTLRSEASITSRPAAVPVQVSSGAFALVELGAIMNYTLSGETRAWMSLSREAKVQWLPKTLQCLQQAPARWQPWLPEFGCSDKVAPTSALCVSLEDQHPSVAELFKECYVAFRDESWMKDVLRHHEPNLVEAMAAPRSMKRELRATESSECFPRKVKREQDALEGSGSVPAVLPAKGLEAVNAVKDEPESPLAPDSSKVYPTGREVSRCLLRNLPFRAMDASKLDIGQVFRGCLAVARRFYGNSWPEHFALVSCGDLATWHMQKADAVYGILCSERPDHWALLCVMGGQAIIYDGQNNQVCYNQAAAFMQHLSEKQDREPGQLIRARCPKQVDDWSCGHRVIASLDAVLSHVEAKGGIPHELDASVLSSARVEALLHQSQDAMHQSPPKRKACKTEPAESAGASQASFSGAMSAPTTPKRARPRLDRLEDSADCVTPPRPCRVMLSAASCLVCQHSPCTCSQDKQSSKGQRAAESAEEEEAGSAPPCLSFSPAGARYM